MSIAQCGLCMFGSRVIITVDLSDLYIVLLFIVASALTHQDYNKLRRAIVITKTFHLQATSFQSVPCNLDDDGTRAEYPDPPT